MKRLTSLFTILCFLFLSIPANAGTNMANRFGMGHSIGGSAATPFIDADGEMLGWKFIATTTSPITDIDLYCDVTGDNSAITYQLAVQSDSSSAPSGTILGATANALITFAGLAADGWTGLKTLTENTGNLVVGTAYWVVLSETTGTPDATHKTAMTEFTNTGMTAYGGGQNKLYTASAWGGADNKDVGCVLKHVDLSYTGYPLTDGASFASGAIDIYNSAGVDNRQGIKFRLGCQNIIQGVTVVFNKVGTPGNITATLYEGSTSKATSAALPPATIFNGDQIHFQFTTPYTGTADTDYYITFGSDGGTDSNDVDMIGSLYNTTYQSAIKPDKVDFVSGSGADPLNYGISNTFLPRFYLIITDLDADLDSAAGGTGAVIPHPWRIGP